jgi:hemerythrin-like domain-containing protein
LEEQILFPALRLHPSLSTLIDELLHEHEQLLALVASLESEAGLSGVETFCRLLPDHVRKEELLLFEQAQELLSPAQLDELGGQLIAKRASLGW